MKMKDRSTDELVTEIELEIEYIESDRDNTISNGAKARIDYALYLLEKEERAVLTNTIKRNSRLAFWQNIIMIVLTIVIAVLTGFLVY